MFCLYIHGHTVEAVDMKVKSLSYWPRPILLRQLRVHTNCHLSTHPM